MKKHKYPLFIAAALMTSSVLSPLAALPTAAQSAQPNQWQQLTDKNTPFNGDISSGTIVNTSTSVIARVSEKLFVSTDNGTSWQERHHKDVNDWTETHISEDGSTFVRIQPGSTVSRLSTPVNQTDNPGAALMLVSTNAGLTWSEVRLEGVSSFYNDIRLSQNGDTIVVTAQHESGNTLLLVSTNAGVSWEDRTPPIEYTSTLINISQQGQTIFAAENQKLFTSHDTGLTWTEQLVPGVESWGAFSFSNDTATIMAKTYDEAWVLNIHVSTDGGQTWIQGNSPVIDGGGQQIAAVVGQDDTLVLSGGIDYIENPQLYISTDLGDTWTTRQIHTFDPAQKTVMSSDGKLIYAAGSTSESSSGLAVSRDLGATWSVVTSDVPYSVISALTISPDGSNVTITARNENDSARHFLMFPGYSTNWQEYTFEGAREWDRLFAASATDEVVYALRDSIQLYASTDKGGTWLQKNTGMNSIIDMNLSPDGSTLIATGYNQEWNQTSVISSDYGNTWIPLEFTDQTTLTNVAFSNNGQKIMLVVYDAWNSVRPEQLYTSVDSGETWTHYTEEGYEYNWTNIFVSSDGSTFIASHVTHETQTSRRLLTSTDSGQTWSQSSEIEKDDGIDFVGGNAPWSASIDGGTIAAVSPLTGAIYLSTDTGKNWSERSLTNSNQILDIVISGDGTVVTVSAVIDNVSTAVFTSSDGGVTWGQYTTANPHTMHISKNGSTIVFASQDRGTTTITSSRDSGSTWSSLEIPYTTGGEGHTKFTINDDGSIITATGMDINSYHYEFNLVSVDAGLTWNTYAVPTSNSNYDFTYAVANNGSYIYAAGYPSHIYGRETITEAPSIQPDFTFTPTPQDTTSTPTSTDPALPQRITNTRPTFTGVAAPNSTVVVTVNSDPIICTTTADGDGNWSCTLPSTIPAGVHKITVQVTNPLTEEVQTIGPYYVQVDASRTIDNTTPGVPNTGFGSPHSTTGSVIHLFSLLALFTAAGALLHRLIQKQS